jgi:hypothetical protein
MLINRDVRVQTINNRNKFKKSIELFHEKSGEVIRTIRFKNQKDFEYFLYGYRSM